MGYRIVPLILTAWISPEDGSYAIGCPLCRVWSKIRPERLGTEMPCPNCGGKLEVNRFKLDADWPPPPKRAA